MTATEVLRRLLDERGVEHYDGTESTLWGYEPTSDSTGAYRYSADETSDGYIQVQLWHVTPEQAIAATLGATDAKPTQAESSGTCHPISSNCTNDCTNSERTGTWVSPTWERWHKSLRHDEIKSIGDAVEQLMYEVIEFGGDMGPNGNTYNGIDEGDVLTVGYINEWVERFENMLGAGTCEADETDTWECVRDDLGGYGKTMTVHVMECTECGHTYEHVNGGYEYCPRCGRKRRDVEE